MRKPLLALSLCASLLLVACGDAETTACGDPGGSTMCPGSDCLSCHGFRAAGTVFAADGVTTVDGASVALTDKNGATVNRTTNSAGNFYTSSALAFPLQRVTITKGGATAQMLDVGAGGCNGCHDAAFRVRLP